jgi:hypothetical protein
MVDSRGVLPCSEARLEEQWKYCSTVQTAPHEEG